MRRSLVLALVFVALGVGPAAAQSIDLGHLGFGLLGGGPGLGMGSVHSGTGSVSSAGISFGTQAEQPGQLTGTFDAATEGLAGSDIIKSPPRLAPEDIRVGR